MDIFWLEAVVKELEGTVTDTRINKIHQPTADTLILRLWNGRQTLRLLITLDSRYSRLHLTECDYPNPFTPPRFCQLLRARLAALTGLRQVPGERIVEFSFRGKDGDYLLMAELLGRHANLVLVDRHMRIVDALKRVSGAAGERSIQPGEMYRLPQHRVHIDLRRELPRVPDEFRSATAFANWLLASLVPMSRFEANRLAAQVAEGRDCQAVLGEFRERLLKGECQPRISGGGEGAELLLFPDVADSSADVQCFSAPSAALDAYFYPLQFHTGQIADGRELVELVRRQIKKLQKRRENIAAEELQKEDFDQRRKWGELLLSHLHLVKRGMKEVEVTDYHQQPPQQVVIRLDPKLTPQENTEACFKRYKKEKRGLGHISRRLQETEAELDWFEGLALALDEAATPAELEDVRRDLLEAGFIQPLRTDRVHRQSVPAESHLLRDVSPSGLTILWGRNNRSNDEISTRQTGKEDLWFHAYNQPGCHLVLKRGEHKGELDDEDILYAASLAAGYSRGRHDHKVEVMVAEGRAVHKPKGTRPGLVTVKAYRTLVVQPRRLKENA
ncbi:MAG: NFACT RNA binding domain-containing protein [Desulfuromonadales bacterium]|nr:NFACT RNA binding domain-containing protein [Desulfuromonadales bacterium]